MDENDAGPAGWFANMNRQASMFEASVIVSAAAAAASAAPAAAATVSDTATAACSVAVSDQTSDVAVDAPAASGGAGHSIGPLMLNQMEDEPAEDQELCSHQYTENSPHGKEKKRSRGTADVWKTVERLADVALMGEMLREHHGRTVRHLVCLKTLLFGL